MRLFCQSSFVLIGVILICSPWSELNVRILVGPLFVIVGISLRWLRFDRVCIEGSFEWDGEVPHGEEWLASLLNTVSVALQNQSIDTFNTLSGISALFIVEDQEYELMIVWSRHGNGAELFDFCVLRPQPQDPERIKVVSEQISSKLESAEHLSRVTIGSNYQKTKP